MNKTSNITTRKNASNRVDVVSANEKKPVTLSEKFACFEKTFGAALTDIARMNAELQLTKDQLADAQVELADVKKENDALHAQLSLREQEIKDIIAQLCDLKKQISSKNDNGGQNTLTTDGAAKFHKTVLRNLPCDDIEDLKLLIEDIWDVDTKSYIVSLSHNRGQVLCFQFNFLYSGRTIGSNWGL